MIDMQRYRFTDNDVRSNENLVDAAYEYLEQYPGEFEFLISCKMRIQQGIDLSIGMVRGVLNCMRVDPRVKFEVEDDEIMEIHITDTRTGRLTMEESSIEEVERPILHPVPPYKPPFVLPAIIKVPYVNAENSHIYHLVGRAWYIWKGSPVLVVRPTCDTQPLKHPILLPISKIGMEKDVNGVVENTRICKRCARLMDNG